MDIIQVATGLLIAGESLTLYTVMRHRDSPWMNPVNQAYVVIDVIVGFFLIASGLELMIVHDVILITSALIHLYRDYEVYRGLENRYAFNTPLLVVLNIRLLALLYLILNN